MTYELRYDLEELLAALGPHTCTGLDSQNPEDYLETMSDEYLMGFLSSSKVTILTKGSGIVPRLEIRTNPSTMAQPAVYLRAMQMTLGTGRIQDLVLMIEEPEPLRQVLQKFIVDAHVPSPHKPKAVKALRLLRARGSQAAPTSATSGSTAAAATAPRDSHTAGGDSSSSTSSSSSSSNNNNGRHTTPEQAADVNTSDTTTNTGADQGARHQQQQEEGKKERTCVSCGGKGEKRCSACRSAWYCSRPCQKADWAEHKKVCSAHKKG